ncbi:NAD-dependent succinate-semialdehyde dehydrogenase [Motiliproteus sp. MSK22-1]|uniref:NAD-dependent succinate-semialdehyde dehydrogenase n=1 Tax=Motiliproteus sp. MSK22-1 TaxID=1897630 RepID=UPI0009788B29|nr:NAD-dependent succinate-semialdehyde dehydrogenase [Motiliproteus sp. MSK22-1]OMH37970.1 succinate-semialdehyde dehydrogenase (NADP(+)) [Motiliproteus sp. MSK22-1]
MNLNDPTLLRTGAFINGRWLSSDETIEVTNPATGEILAEVPDFGQVEARSAIRAADVAWPLWREKTAAERSRMLRKWATLIQDNLEDISRILTLEQGKPLTESRGEIAYALSYLEWFAEEGRRAYGELIPPPSRDKRILINKEPVGVCAAITPWNFPAAMITRKTGAALAAGCPIVVKPASQTPLTALALAELANRAGIPPGVFSVITGSARAIGAEMTSSTIVRKLSFTGSTEIGRLLMEQSGKTLKKLSLELGGNAPFVVFDDADIDTAVSGAIASKFRNTGQTCVCTNRFYVQRGVYQQFIDKLRIAVSELRVGNGMENDSTQGPLIDQSAVAKVEEHIADALSKGATLVFGGHRHDLGGQFFEPTILSGISSEMLIAQEETFGPLAPISVFDDEKEALALANQTEFGLAAYFYTADVSRSWRFSEALEVGMVGVNTGIISTEVAPFGGIKQSGLGREGGRQGLDEYLVDKYVCFGELANG